MNQPIIKTWNYKRFKSKKEADSHKTELFDKNYHGVFVYKGHREYVVQYLTENEKAVQNVENGTVQD